MSVTIYPSTDLVDFRKHSIYQYAPNIFKIIQFFDDRLHTGPGPRENWKSSEDKLPSSISRSKKIVLEYALCNHWDYFVSLTLSPATHNRFDLQSFHKSFMRWITDRRKTGVDIKLVLIPERHEDGAWHAHGLMSGIPDNEVETFRSMRKRGVKVPTELVNSDNLSWRPYADKYGFCCIGKLKHPIAASFYCLKYMTKDNSRLVTQKGSRLYWNTRPLDRAEKLTDLYTRSPELDRLLTQKHDFCATGFVFPGHKLDWADFLSLDTGTIEQIDFSDLAPMEDSAAMAEAESYFDFEQLALEKYSRRCNYGKYI